MRRTPWMTPLILLALLVPALAANAQATADDIIAKAAAARHAGNSVQSIQLTQTASNGQSQVKTADIHTRVDGDAVETHAIVRSPADLAGFQLLSTQDEGGNPVVWLYMNQGGNLLQITGANRKGPFLSTDFSYEDLALGDPGDGTHTLIGPEEITVAGTAYVCDKVETTPLPELKSQYGRIITWIDQGSSLPRRIDLLDTGGNVVKRMTFEAFASHGSTSLPTRIRMENLKKDSNTVLEVTSHQLDVGNDQLPTAMFDPQQLHTVQ